MDPWAAWAIMAAIGGVAVVSVLHAFASAVELQKQVHDTKLKAAGLKRAYAEQQAQIEAMRELEESIEIVGQGSMDMAQAA